MKLENAIAIAALLAACAGGSPSTGAAPGQPPAAGQALRGTITARSAGSITVNGIAVATASAAVRVERQAATEQELQRGMVVVVKGTFDDRLGTGQATEVEFEDALRGRAGADVAPGAPTAEIGGRTVHLEDSTRVFDDRGNDLTPGSLHREDRLRVSGFTDDQGRLRATGIQRLAQASADDSFEVKGFVIAIAADRASFDLSLSPGGSLAFRVTFTSGTLAAAVSVGSFVEVRAPGAAAGTAVSTGADQVSLDDRQLGEAQDHVEVEGIVTAGTSAAFALGDQQVSTSAATRWENGVPDDLVPGAAVEAEGHLDAAGVLAAEKVSFRASVRLQGPATGVTAAGFTVLGIAVARSPLADERVAPVEAQALEVRGRPGAAGAVVIATRIDQASGNGRLFVQGPVAAADSAAGTLVILGIEVSTGAATRYYRHRDELHDIGRTAFFAEVVAGRSVVKARLLAEPAGAPPAAAADELELEDEPSAP